MGGLGKPTDQQTGSDPRQEDGVGTGPDDQGVIDKVKMRAERLEDDLEATAKTFDEAAGVLPPRGTDVLRKEVSTNR